RIPAHGAELVENENAAVLAGAGLAIEGRPRGLDLDRNGRESHQGCGQYQPDGRERDVEKPLDDLGAGSLDEAVRKDEPAGPQLRDQDLPGGLFIEGRPVLD